MKVDAEEIENCQVVLNIEAEADELDKSLDESYHRLVNKVSIPGFRKGKAPRVILEQHLGKDTLLEDALERLIPQLYREAIESRKLEPIAEPQIEVIQTEPVALKAIVSLKPTIKLGDYHNLKLKPELVEIGDKEIESAIEELWQEHGVLVPVDRPVQFGDFVTISIEADIEGKPFLRHKDMVYEVNENSTFPLPEFAQNLEGVRKNEERIFTIDVPADYSIEELAGKECFFKVTVTEVKEKELPELDDEFAKSIGYDNLTLMRERVTTNLKAKAEGRSRLELRQKALDATAEISEVDYPPIIENREIDRLLEDEARRFGYREIQDYLKRTNKTEEERRAELRPVAKQRVIHSLILEKIAQEEKIEISTLEVDNKVEEIVKDTEDKDKMRQFLILPQVRESIGRSLRTEKVVNRLVQIVTEKEV